MSDGSWFQLDFLDTTVGDFAQLSVWAELNRRMARHVADDSGAGLLMRVVAGATIQMRDLAAGAAPVDTGTLRSSHRNEFRSEGDTAVGIVEIDPYAVNPVNNSRPSYYGELWVNRNFNWFERIAEAHGPRVLDEMEQAVVDRIDDIWL